MLRSQKSRLGRRVFLVVRVGWWVLSLLFNFRSVLTGGVWRADVLAALACRAVQSHCDDKAPGPTRACGLRVHTLPFGACVSVLRSTRVSALLRRVMLGMCILPSLCCDACPVMMPAYLGKNTEASLPP